MKIILLISLIIAFKVQAQTYSLLSNRNVFTDEIIIDAFKNISAKCEGVQPKFDATMPFSNVSIITDKKGKTYRLLIQFAPDGKPGYMGVDQALYAALDCGAGGEMKFNSCVKQEDIPIGESWTEEVVVNCLIERLNYCDAIIRGQPR
jgi:hypothetical protein